MKVKRYNQMIAGIIKQVYEFQPDAIKQMFEQPIICGYLFRSFDDFTQHVIFQMYANQGIITKQQVMGKMERSLTKEGEIQFDNTMHFLVRIRVVSRPQLGSHKYTLNQVFQKKLNQFIMTPMRDFGQPHGLNNDQFFNLLLLLSQEHNEILNKCKIGNMNNRPQMTKQNFEFIRQPIGYKISILIKGYLKLKRTSKDKRYYLTNILDLSSMQPSNKYKISPKNAAMVQELEKIRLVKRIEQKYYIINPYLHNFAFQQKRNAKLLECSIIIQTNFKVYVQIARSNNRQNYRLIRNIMRSLIRIDHEDYEFEQLIMGEIKQDIMNNLFPHITVQDYLSFFLEYMSADLNIEKDLGKWNKIRFLGLEGPEGEMMIPNNVRQELKLWESMSHNATLLKEYDNNQN